MVLLKTYTADADDTSESGTCFVRTDQLDGETDWKLRLAVPATQPLSENEIAALRSRAVVVAGPPSKDLHSFVGTFTIHPPDESPTWGLSLIHI